MVSVEKRAATSEVQRVLKFPETKSSRKKFRSLDLFEGGTSYCSR